MILRHKSCKILRVLTRCDNSFSKATANLRATWHTVLFKPIGIRQLILLLLIGQTPPQRSEDGEALRLPTMAMGPPRITYRIHRALTPFSYTPFQTGQARLDRRLISINDFS